MYIRIQISKLPNQTKAIATRQENREEKENIYYTYTCIFLAPPAKYLYVVCTVYHTIVLQYDVYPLPKKHPCGVCICI